MSLGYKYFRSSLIKLMILSVAFPFILWDFFTGKDTKSEPGAIYLLIFIWIGGTAFLVWQMVRAKRRERKAARTLLAEPDGPANGSQPFSSEQKTEVIGGWLIAIPELFIEARRARRSCSPQLL